MNPSFFRRKPFALWVPLSFVLGLYWFYFNLNPLMGFINADGSVPFHQAIAPWKAQDLFYWGTSRMGMLYEVMWKLGLTLLGIRESIVGSWFHTQMFYLGHVFVFFLGFPFWLESFKTWEAKLLFFIFFVPLTGVAAAFFLTPGQPYGALFLLTGIFYWYMTRSEETKKRHFVFAVLIGMLWIQHELCGLSAFVVYASQYFRRLRDLWSSKSLKFGLSLALILAFTYWFKWQSQQWVREAHYRFADLQTITDSLWFTIRDGRWWPTIRRGTGHVLTFGILFYVIDAFRNWRKTPVHRDLHAVSVIMAIGSLVAIHLSRWYVLNNRDTRYFTCFLVIILWGFISKFETLPKNTAKRIFYLAICIVPLYTMQSFDHWTKPFIRSSFQFQLDPKDHLFDATVQFCEPAMIQKAASPEIRDSFLFQITADWEGEACNVLTHLRTMALSDAVQSEGCAGYIDDYWNAHVLTPASSGRILASAGTHIRNPELFAEILAARPLCVMPRPGVPFQTYVSHLDCKPTPYGFLKCQ